MLPGTYLGRSKPVTNGKVLFEILDKYVQINLQKNSREIYAGKGEKEIKKAKESETRQTRGGKGRRKKKMRNY